jgi:hypothetical protein
MVLQRNIYFSLIQTIQLQNPHGQLLYRVPDLQLKLLLLGTYNFIGSASIGGKVALGYIAICEVLRLIALGGHEAYKDFQNSVLLQHQDKL